jgi:hypothetical protein
MVNFTAERLFEKSKFCRELDLLANLPLILAKNSFYWRKFDFIGENHTYIGELEISRHFFQFAKQKPGTRPV